MRATGQAHHGDRQDLAIPSLGIDLGGTKVEAIALHPDGHTLAKIRRATPRNDYHASVRVIAELAACVEHECGLPPGALIGVGIPGSLAPATGLVQNANSTWLNGKPLATDLGSILQNRPLRLANDANCFALSEAEDGAGCDATMMFGVILGTGCGGGIVHKGHLMDGPRGIGGEWGHNPLPWPDELENHGPHCWCGRSGCLETWISGPGLSADHERASGEKLTVEDIVARADPASNDAGARTARATLERHTGRLARGLAHVINLIDPDVIVLGGGLSNLDHLYQDLPERIAPYIFADDKSVVIRPPRFGDASGARGAARLWRQSRHGQKT